MSTRSECKGCKSPWSTSCPSLSSGGFALVVTIILSEQFKGIQIWIKIFGLIEHPCSFRRSSKYKSCSKLDIISLRNFPDLYLFSFYFSRGENWFWDLFKYWKALTCGRAYHCLYRPMPSSYWLHRVVAIVSPVAARIKKPWRSLNLSEADTAVCLLPLLRCEHVAPPGCHQTTTPCSSVVQSCNTHFLRE
jgi:hypothetical protein